MNDEGGKWQQKEIDIIPGDSGVNNQVVAATVL